MPGLSLREVKWLSRILGRGEDIPDTVAFDEIDTWLERVTNTLFCGLNPDAYDEVVTSREGLRDSINKLRDASPKGDMPAQVTKIGLLGRDKMVKLLYSLCDRLVIPARMDYRTVSEFHNTASRTIDSVLSKVSKEAYFVRSLFPDELKEVETCIDNLITVLNRLARPLKTKEKEFAELARVYALIHNIRSQMADIDSEGERIRVEEAEYRAIKRGLERSEYRLRAIERRPEWKRLLACQSELAALKDELAAAESEIKDMFAPIQKPLYLLRKQDDTGRLKLAPDVRAAVDSILDCPVQALNERYLRAIRMVIHENSGILKDSRRASALRWIDHLLSTDLEGLSARYRSLIAKEEALRRELSDMGLKSEREELEHAIATAKGQLARLEEAIAKRKRGIASRQQELAMKKEQLQRELENITGKPIVVVYSEKQG